MMRLLITDSDTKHGWNTYNITETNHVKLTNYINVKPQSE